MEEIKNIYGHTTSEIIAMQKRCYSLRDIMNKLVKDVNTLDNEINSYKTFIEELNNINTNINGVINKINSGYDSFISGGFISKGQDISKGKLQNISEELQEQIKRIENNIKESSEKLNDKIRQRNNKINEYQKNNEQKEIIKNNWREIEIQFILNSIYKLKMCNNYFYDLS